MYQSKRQRRRRACMWCVIGWLLASYWTSVCVTVWTIAIGGV